MPERIAGQLSEWREIFWFAFVGAAISIGQLLASKETLTWRIVCGRAISSAGLGVASGAVLVWFPEMTFGGQLGIAAGLASLGTSGLEKVFQRFSGGQ